MVKVHRVGSVLTLADELLHELRAGHTDEGAVGVVSNSSGQQRLPGARRSVQQHPLQVNTREQNSITTCDLRKPKQRALGAAHLRLRDPEGLEQFRVLDGQLDHLLDLFDLLVQTTDHLVGRVRHLQVRQKMFLYHVTHRYSRTCRNVKYLLHHHERHQRVHLVGEDLV